MRNNCDIHRHHVTIQLVTKQSLHSFRIIQFKCNQFYYQRYAIDGIKKRETQHNAKEYSGSSRTRLSNPLEFIERATVQPRQD